LSNSKGESGVDIGIREDNKQRGNKKYKVILIVSACVFVAAAAVAAVLLLGGQGDAVRILDFGTVVKGVSINGIDVSGKTKDETLSATADLEAGMLGKVKFSLDVNGEVHEFSAEDFSVGTDYMDIVSQSASYGHRGTFEQRLEAFKKAAAEGVNFTVSLTVDKDKLSGNLAELKTALDKEPKDAGFEFMPWGYTVDESGAATAYQPDINAMVEELAHGREYKRPELVRIPNEEMPIPLRYKFYNDDEGYKKDYIPPDANIARFFYKPHQTGLKADTAAVTDEIISQVNSAQFSTITVPVEVTEPGLKLDGIKANTQLIASWSSSFSGHYSYGRNWNVARISAFINGNVIQPGQKLSINEVAGPRNDSTARTVGWKKASGIENGGYSPQVGGGVCQLGSTTFNAAIRSGLKIAKSFHHSIPSDYVPLGLDATLNTKPDLDLVLENTGTLPYFLVSYVNPKDKNVTVEVYGPPLIDPEHPEWGNVIYDYTFKNLGRYGSPGSKTHTVEVPTEAPDGTIVDASNPTYVYAKGRRGTKVRTYRHIYSLDGIELCDPIEFEYHEYPTIDSVTYVYAPPAPPADPGTPPAAPAS
jgi:vancomycin resistance protein YoaR